MRPCDAAQPWGVSTHTSPPRPKRPLPSQFLATPLTLKVVSPSAAPLSRRRYGPACPRGLALPLASSGPSALVSSPFTLRRTSLFLSLSLTLTALYLGHSCIASLGRCPTRTKQKSEKRVGCLSSVSSRKPKYGGRRRATYVTSGAFRTVRRRSSFPDPGAPP